MEMTPQQIDDVRTQAEIERQVKQSCTGLPFDEAERQALAQHPPVFRPPPTGHQTASPQN